MKYRHLLHLSFWQISISIISQILFRMTSGHDRFTVANFPSQCKQQQKDETFLDTVPQIEEIIERSSFINLIFCLEFYISDDQKNFPLTSFWFHSSQTCFLLHFLHHSKEGGITIHNFCPCTLCVRCLVSWHRVVGIFLETFLHQDSLQQFNYRLYDYEPYYKVIL